MLLIDSQLISGRMDPENLSQNEKDSQDVVDFVTTKSEQKPDKYSPFLKHRDPKSSTKTPPATKGKIQFDLGTLSGSRVPGTLYGDCEPPSSAANKPSFPTLLRTSRKKSEPTQNHTASAKDKPKFIKSASIARLFGNTYSTKKCEVTPAQTTQLPRRPFPLSDRFQRCDNDDMHMPEFSEKKDLSTKALRTISRSISKLLWRQSHSVDISVPDPEFKVSYLGNVLTGWARGESSSISINLFMFCEDRTQTWRNVWRFILHY